MEVQARVSPERACRGQGRVRSARRLNVAGMLASTTTQADGAMDAGSWAQWEAAVQRVLINLQKVNGNSKV